MTLDKWWLMLILHYLIFKNNYVVLNFNYGILWYVTISTSWYVSMSRFMENDKGDDDDDDDDTSTIQLAADYKQ